MRFLDSSKRSRIARICIVLSSTTALAACGALGGESPTVSALANPVLANGPQADYPVVIGDPYQIGNVSYRPADVLDYDEVGYVAAGGGNGYSGGHHTLPLPSYVEVTSLATGRTILVRLEQRGPMGSNHLVSLSPSAMAQLDATPDTPVRVRRVNAPEMHRMLLRDDQPAPVRMDTPMGLVEVLRRRLPAEGSASLSTPVLAAAPEAAPAPVAPVPAAPAPLAPPPAVVAVVTPPPAVPAAQATGDFEEAFAAITNPPREASTPAPAAARPAVTSGFVVQAAAFSTADRARRAANALGGHVEAYGSLFRVRTGPYATRAEADASLRAVRAAGFGDARVVTSG
jgi:rare lipoprotein A